MKHSYIRIAKLHTWRLLSDSGAHPAPELMDNRSSLTGAKRPLRRCGDSSGTRQAPVTGRYEYGNEHSGSMQREKLLDCMSDSLPAVKADFRINTAEDPWSLYVPHSGHYMYRTVVTTCTAQWSLYVPHSGHYMYQFYVLPTQCIYVFCVDLRTNSDYFPIQH